MAKTTIDYNEFIFSPRYRLRRHICYWTLHIIFWTFFWCFMERYGSIGTDNSRLPLHVALSEHLVRNFIWLPVNILYSYSIAYTIVPAFLLKGKYVQFFLFALPWIIAGLLINFVYRVYVYIPAQQAMHFYPILQGGWQSSTYLMITLTAANITILRLFKYWLKKQQEWLLAEKEKVTVELQFLKAQVHPHFLFNTLNNIYSFSLENSSKTPALILKLSSLLSYMLYDCNMDEVRLEKEIEIMKNYIDLEKERYGNKFDISWMVNGEIKDKFIAPLLLLPFLENAFKHGISEQVEKPWLSVDIAANDNVVKCKMINSKNLDGSIKNGGIGIQNAMKRLAILYPGKHELKLSDEGNFFVVSLMVDVNKNGVNRNVSFPQV
ncbi:MAG TPA: histidine kinase [Puia sp.]|nr:histidine kinase [Puia sp.]